MNWRLKYENKILNYENKYKINILLTSEVGLNFLCKAQKSKIEKT